MRVGHVTAWLGPSGGGIPEAVRPLAARQAALGLDARLFGLGRPGEDAGPCAAPAVAARVLGPAAFGFAPGLRRALTAARPDVLHVHGLWMYPSALAASLGGTPRLVSPHGMLDPWALGRGGWKKRLAARLYENAHLRGAACLHALTEAERDEIRAFGLANPVCVLPNGVEPVESWPAGAPPWPSPWPDGWLRDGRRVLLFLGRLHPKKGLEPLLRGWAAASAEAERHGWRLALVGRGTPAYEARLARLVKELGVGRSAALLGPRHGAGKAACLAHARAFVLPSFGEGLPMAALEALAHGLPALLSEGCRLPRAFAVGAALEAAPDPTAVARALRRMFDLGDAGRRRMGEAGRTLVAREFDPARAAAAFVEVYDWMRGGGPAPSCVEVERAKKQKRRNEPNGVSGTMSIS